MPRPSLMAPMSDRPSSQPFLSERRLTWYAIAMAVVCAAMVIMLWPTFHSNQAGHHCIDFNWIWLTGKLAVSHAAAQVYHPSGLPPDVAAMSQFHCTHTAGDGQFAYPPTILFFTYLLGFLPYYAAMAAWVGVTLLLYMAAVYTILPSAAAVAVALTTYPVALNILIGHNGFLTAGLFGLALAFVERRPWLAGVFLGLLTYKPQFGILFPVALLASRNWRAFGGAAAASIAFGAAAAIAFGYGLWASFVTGITEAATGLSHHDTVSRVVFPTVRGVLRHLEVGGTTSWAVQIGVTAAVVVVIGALWSRPIPYSLKAAALGVAALLGTSYALSYDYCILSMAVAFLVRDGMVRGFLRGERTLLILCWGGFSLFAFVGAVSFARLTGNPSVDERLVYFVIGVTPIFVCATLLAQIIRRALSVRLEAPGPAAIPQLIAG